MSESLDQTRDRVAERIVPDDTSGHVHVVETRYFPGVLVGHTALNPEDPNTESMKWFRSHEKRRLKAYLKGNQYFAHGRVAAYPIGYRNVMWPVQPKPTVNDPSPDQQVA